jgi:TonB-linked SusC/RagA family outer membrane protein
VFNPFTDYGEVQNPLAEMYTPTRKNWADKFVTSFWADLELYKGLTLRSSYGVDMAFWGYNEWNRPYWRNRVSRSTDSSAGAQFNRGFTWQLENTLNYVKTIDRHNFTVLLGQSARANRNSTNLTGSKKNLRGLTPGVPYPYEDKAYINFSDDAQGLVSGGPVNPYRIASYFGRLSYNFDERYMLEATLRRDGSTRFGANNRWAYFPSVSAGWNITNEEFAKSLPGWVSNLKLRASWGQNGNDSINDFSYTANMGYGNPNKYIWGADSSLGVYKVGAQPSLIPNPDLMWEASEQIDLGLEAGLFKNSLNLSIDWYQKNTKQMLLEMSMPQYVGNSLPKGNLGNMYNSGIELEMSYNLVRNNWSLGIDANATYLKNRLESLGNASGFQNIPFANDNWGPGNFRRDENGYPFHYFWGRKTDGIFQNQAEVDAYVNGKGEKYQPNAKPGDVRFVDVTGDGLIDDKDKTMIGNYFPTWAYSFTISASWKSFDMSAFWQGVADVDIFDYTRRTDRGGYNQPSYWMGRWHGEGTSNSLPKYTWLGGGDNDLSSDLYVQNGAYLRLKSLQVGYTIPEHISKRVLISRLRVYFMAENLLTFTGYRGFDPEVNEGVDSGLYPQPRTLSVGLNLTF